MMRLWLVRLVAAMALATGYSFVPQASNAPTPRAPAAVTTAPTDTSVAPSARWCLARGPRPAHEAQTCGISPYMSARTP